MWCVSLCVVVWCVWCVWCVLRGLARGKTPVCRLKTPPCVVQNVPVYAGTTRTCGETCARFASIHGDVLNVHTEVF